MDIVGLTEVREAIEDVIRDGNQLSASSDRSVLQVLSDNIEHSSLLDQRVTCNRAMVESASFKIE